MCLIVGIYPASVFINRLIKQWRNMRRLYKYVNFRTRGRDRANENPENFDHRASDEFVGSDYRNGIYVGLQQKKVESLTNEKHFNCDGCS